MRLGNVVERECELQHLALLARGTLNAKLPRLALLTQREREVMHCVISGKINRVIAEELSIGVKTVEAHRAKIMEKLEIGSLAELVQIGMPR